MTERFTGRVALVTGGAAGIGRATVERLVAEGARVVIIDLDAAGAEALADELGVQALAVAMDVADEAAWIKAVAQARTRFGRLDYLVNCAGVGGGLDVEQESLDHWSLVMNSNVAGTFLGCKHAIAAMRESGGGAIVNISSSAGIRTVAALPAYSAAKAAVLQFTRCVALHCAKAGHGVRCNSILPGITDTPRLRYREEEFGDTDAMLKGLVAQFQPLGRPLEPEEIAASILYLLSDEAAGITGAALAVDGGFLL